MEINGVEDYWKQREAICERQAMKSLKETTYVFFDKEELRPLFAELEKLTEPHKAAGPRKFHKNFPLVGKFINCLKAELSE